MYTEDPEGRKKNAHYIDEHEAKEDQNQGNRLFFPKQNDGKIRTTYTRRNYRLDRPKKKNKNYCCREAVSQQAACVEKYSVTATTRTCAENRRTAGRKHGGE